MKTKEPVWAVVMFDLSVETAQLRREATRYRTHLLNLGFTRLQLSVYGKYLINSAGFDWLARRIALGIPDDGNVRVLIISDVEWSKSLIFEGAKLKKAEDKPEQLRIF